LFPGLGTLVNAAAVLAGASLGVLVGHRLSERTRDVVTDALGLVTLLIAASSATAVADPALRAAVGTAAPTLVVLGSLVVGGVAGSILGIERRLEDLGGWLRERLLRRTRGGTDRERFVEGFVTSSLVFCVGPLTILGALNEGLGRGSDQLLLKATLDGFASIAFAASLGWGVAASVLSVLVIQGAMTAVGLLLGDVLTDAEVAALAATGGLMLVGVALRLLRIRAVPVGDLLPALVLAPALTALVAALRG
jgi:uncharacterized membrane protein YqgA involved in biofilm formation